jgi:hypothetical protein
VFSRAVFFRAAFSAFAFWDAALCLSENFWLARLSSALLMSLVYAA